MNNRDPNPNKLNIYTCKTCGEHVVTRDVDKGTTPMLMGCQATIGCRGAMQSSFYRVFDPEGIMKNSHEWYKPPIVLMSWDRATREHVMKGGLLLRHCSPLRRVSHKKRGSTYDVIGFARAQTEDAILDNDTVFVYRSTKDGSMSVRKVAEFEDGRFKDVEP